MADLNLFCLTDGDPTSRAFDIDIEPAAIVSILRKAIKAQKNAAFADVAADKLKLWRVSVPVVAGHIHNAVFLNEIDSKTELIPTDDVSDVFPNTPAKEIIHIIVQRHHQAT
ncbi:hypothetical protein BC939DRAFT_514699 [Gamsiella multidivaricata]|uniref:uncharacterized protein n=1 Tax=Gamsiella multidivaricata TaxID=101098 RepID=UPI00221FAFFD|nr:uncharacterized protein BC939DRAFT_514699 [Gamsiella multidivaricata]KAG0357838.1 hypothetical protein BGZ54_000165 [Gamsiella multidivaricata]KAI7826225.1 hypothetical protein BC939DRAFT_514699 [Gamsiella multidivaricata]